MTNKILLFPGYDDRVEYYQAKYQEAYDRLKELTSLSPTVENARKFRSAHEEVLLAREVLLKIMKKPEGGNYYGSQEDSKKTSKSGEEGR